MLTEKEKQLLHEQYNPEGSPMRNFQLNLLKILVKFDQFARKHNIQYSLGYGTLLGAIRHQGFIPWDDDMDIFMSRPMWEKLKNYIKEDDLLVDDLYIKGYARPVLSIEGLGIVDIFIMDYCPKNKFQRRIKLQCARFVSLLIKCKERILRHNYKRKKPWFVLMPLAALIPLKTLKRMWNFVARWYEPITYSQDDKGCIYNSCIMEMYQEFPILPMLSNMIDIEFEGHTMMCVADYDNYLRISYDDYMSMPKHITNLGRVTDDTYCEIRSFKTGSK